MIIKKAIIKSFGGLKDCTINFTQGINLVYGENEKGKSTIQNFIRAFLFGFSNTRGNKNNLRKKYAPFSGEKIQGELIVSHKGKEYIISRTFGNTKKDDTSIIYDGVTGKEITDINKEEPGTYFLGVNGKTFLKTLFIPQLGVALSKDKEEEIMERIIDIFGCGEGEVSIDKAIGKLKDNRKDLTTTRKNGSLDILKRRYSTVIEERYEAYKVSEENLINEDKLINKKDESKKIREEISNLELLKKYLKRSKLQKEYREITNYLKKSERLKREEKEIQDLLKRSNGIISEEYLVDLSEENKKYLTLLDIKKENEYDLKELEKKIEDENIKINNYEIFSSMEDNLKEQLIKLSTEQEGLRERVLLSKKLTLSIEEEERKINEKKKFLGDVFKLTPYKEEIKSLFNEYEGKLHMLKEEIEGKSNKVEDKGRNLKKYISYILILGGGLLLGVNIGSIHSMIIYLISVIVITLGLIIIILGNSNNKGSENSIESLNKDIEIIEEQLKKYMHLIKCNNCENLLRGINTLESFFVLESKSKLRIEERNAQLKDIYSKEDEEKYNKNKKILNSIMKLCRCDSLDEVYIQLDQYNKLKQNIILLELEYNSKEEGLKRVIFELEEKEKDIKDKLRLMDLEEVPLVDLEMHLKEYKEKIEKKKDLEKALENVNETYKVLIKDRDIESIKEELKDILIEDLEYSYESEEEIEGEIKKKSNYLIDIEKEIKDIENIIKTSFLGKREISVIEEDLQNLMEDINSNEKKLKAIDIAIDNLEKASREIRESFGPRLNKNILKEFKELTLDKYSEVKLGENYEMIVRDNYNIFPGEYLSNGTNDQLYLALRIAFIDLIYKGKEFPVIFDDSFVQYDDIRRESAIKLINNKKYAQTIVFSCQSIEKDILNHNNIKFNYIKI